MSVSNLYILIDLCLLCSACVEPYEPVLEESQEVLVISGMISDKPGRHEVKVSRSSPYHAPEFQGVEHCVVHVSDQDGNMIHYSDQGDGIYAVDLPESFLEVGDAASLYVMTPNSREYRSDYDVILPCPEIDKLYWELQYKETSDPEKSLPGIQFYLDMSGSDSDARNVIWRVSESWEYWASLYGNKVLLDFHHTEDFITSKIFKCWKTLPLDHIYTGSTRNLNSNSLKKVALNFVSNETDRLRVSYRLLVKQQSLSLEAYDYWQQMNILAAESGECLRNNLHRLGEISIRWMSCMNKSWDFSMPVRSTSNTSSFIITFFLTLISPTSTVNTNRWAISGHREI